MAGEVGCEVRALGYYPRGVRVSAPTPLQHAPAPGDAPDDSQRRDCRNLGEDDTSQHPCCRHREAVKPAGECCPRLGPACTDAAGGDEAATRAPPAPILTTNMQDGLLITTLDWPASTAVDGECGYVVESDRLGQFEPVLETREPRAQLAALPRGALHRFRYRLRTHRSLGPPSHIATCVIEYQSEIDPPLDINVRGMEQYEAEYVTTTVVGHGAYGNVVLVQDRAGRSYAAKTVKIVGQRQRDTARHEFTVMRMLSHSKIVSLIAAFENKHRFVIISEFLGGGELFERILEDNTMTEADCILYVKQICEGVAYLHHQRVLHLDLKAENIVCVDKGSKLIKIIDFGLAVVCAAGDTVYSMFGTREYMAPEIIMYEPISTKTDMWSIGVITYLLLSGLLPFIGESWGELSTNIQVGNFNFEEEVFNSVSELSKQFICSLLVVKPERRMSAVDCLNHLWLSSDPPQRDLMSHTKENYKTYLASYKAKWHKAGNVLIAARRLRTNVEAGADARSVPT